MKRPPLLIAALLILLVAGPPVPLWGADEAPAPEPDPLLELARNLTEEDRQVVEILDLLEILELLNEYDNVAALEETP